MEAKNASRHEFLNHLKAFWCQVNYNFLKICFPIIFYAGEGTNANLAKLLITYHNLSEPVITYHNMRYLILSRLEL